MSLPALVALAALSLALPAGAATLTVRHADPDGEGSLRRAVEDAEAGDLILFGSNVRGTIALSDTLDLAADVTLRGPGADVVTVRSTAARALRLRGTAAISGLTIAGGTDAAVELRRGRLTLVDSAVRDSGGTGIDVQDARLTLMRTLVAGNSGLGVRSDDGEVTCVNATIAGNGGGGVRIEDGRLELANCTVVDNRGAGIAVGGGTARVRNTVVARNLRACAGPVTSDGHNLVDDATCALAGSGDQQSADPRLGPLARNGGPTETAAPTGGSPAIDAGDESGCVDPQDDRALVVDQRGMRRPAGPRCDIGAVETPAAVTGRTVNRIVALVDGDPITAYEVRRFAQEDPRIAQSGASPGDVLEIVITKKVLEKEIEAQGIRVTDVEIDRYVANVRQRNNISEEQLEAALAQQGLTRARYRAQIKEELERAQLINREIRGKVSVSPEEVERYRAAQGEPAGATPVAAEEPEPPVVDDEERVVISHIVLQLPADGDEAQVAAVQARADALYAQLQDGADFAALAARESEDGTARSGGALGTFRPAELREELADAVRDLDPGEVSRPVRSGRSIHIVRLDERQRSSGTVAAKPAAPPPTDTAFDEIKERLYAQALEERYNRWLREDLRQRHSVEIRP